MQDLTLVGLTEDKSKLILVGDSGDEYSLRVDAKLRAALGGDHGRPGRLERKMESALRPRDIQARIRAGESPESVAEAAQTTVDRIMSFATPVLAERAHIAERAQRASLRRRAGDGPARLLGDAVAEHLRGRNIDPEGVTWDAWRREDGRWTLVADLSSGSGAKRGEFVFDAPGRYVVAEDDDARWLVGEQTPVPASPAAPPGVRRLTAVTEDPELELGSDALDLVSPAQAEPERPGARQPEETSADLDPMASRFRSRRTVEVEPGAASGDADWMATQASDRPVGLRPTRAPDQPRQPDQEPTGGPDETSEPSAPSAHADGETAETATEGSEKQAPPTRKTGRKKGRASVPSWDEIMFGGGKAE